MYKIRIIVENPVLGEHRLMTFQFDAATLDQARWNAGYTAVKEQVDSLLASAANPTRPDLIPTSM